MRRFLLTFCLAILATIAMQAEMTITWDASTISISSSGPDPSYSRYSDGGITLTANNGSFSGSSGFSSGANPSYEGGDEFTFSCATANITRIEITCSYPNISASGWTSTYSGLVWTGSATSVNFGRSASYVTQIVFTTDGVVKPDMLEGEFSVSATKKVRFSKGNLQYKASTDSWQFANNQYEIIGNNPGNTTYSNRDTQSAWIDLFGWGTGNKPWTASSSSYDYSSYTEWGSQFDTENGWFTLSYDEWDYLLFERYNYNPGVSYAKGTVNGVVGLIILPDDWNTSYYALSNTNSSYASYSSNEISLSDWTTSLEAHGAVFLPATGWRSASPSMRVNDSENGYYWTSSDYTYYSSSNAYSLIFSSSNMQLDYHSDCYEGYAVRLVSAGPPPPPASISVMPAAINGLEYNGSYQTLITAGTAEGGEMQYSTDNEYWSTYLPEGRYAGEYTIYYKVVGDEEHEDYIPEQNQLHISISDGSDWDGNLSTTTSNKRAKDGTVITGTLAANVEISILSGATVTLRDATINGVANSSYQWAGITCEGDATIIVEGDNTIRGFYQTAGITVPVGSTLTIDGSGTLAAIGAEWGAGIGSGFGHSTDCGNIVINGGIITAIGNGGGAGIGSGYSDVTCGNITINGGIITATGNGAGAGIGSGASGSSCGNITINGGIVTATNLNEGAGIGTGFSNCTCGNISITGGVINAAAGDNAAGIGSGFSSCVCGNITISGGDITATGNDNGAGIGAGYLSTCGDITITCGHVVATRGSSSAAPIGEGFLGTCGTISVADYLTDDNSTPTRTISAEYATLSAAPTAIVGLVYNGSAHTLINAGTAGIGTMSYSIDNIHWSASLPTAAEVGEYTVYYKVVGDATHNDYIPSPNTVVVNIKTTVYLVPGVWAADGAQFAAYVFNEGEDGVWSAIMTPTADGKAYKADVNACEKIIFVRLKNTATSANWNDKWNQTDDLTFASNNCFQITGWSDNKGVGRWRNYPFYYVQFQDYDETVLKRDTVDSGNAATAPADPSRTGYAFTGWDKAFNAITSDLTVTAQYEAIYNLTLKQNTEDADKWSVTPNTALAGTTIDLTYSGSKRVASVVATPTSSGTPLDVTETSSNHYQFTMPASDVEIEVEYHPFEGTGTAEDPYLIASEEDWNTLADKVAGGKNYADTYFRQTDDISVTNMVGEYSSHPFSGIYDGDGHTLTVTYNTTAELTAPFRCARGATIKNLHTAGTITTTQKQAAGLIGCAYDANTILNCRSSVEINSSVNGDGTHGGFIGSIDGSSSNPVKYVIIEGCIFDGRLLGSNTSDCGGFVGWCSEGKKVQLDVRNSLYAPQEVTIHINESTWGDRTFARGLLSLISITNSYYTQSLGVVQGKQAYSITAGSGVTVTNAGAATEYNVSGITSYGTGIKYNGVLYAGEGDEVSLNLSGSPISDYEASAGTLSGDNNPYTLTMAAANTVVSSITTTPLTFEAKEAGAEVRFSVEYGDLPEVEYSTDGTTWTAYSEPITLAAVGDKVSFRGNNATYRNNYGGNAQFSCSTDCYIYGNIMSLVDADDYAAATELTAEYTFSMMFYYNIFIKNHPSKDLVLPATTLANGCYDAMFAGCTGLTTAPALPATTMAERCYSSMFTRCTSLTSAPALPATTLAERCYYGMFSGCTGLTTAPELLATTLASECCSSMFHGCTGMISVPENMLPATTLAYYCYYNMFYGCTGLTTAPALPATTLAEGCYSHMFEGCTNLTSAPALPATTLAEDCYTGMFQYCSRLESAPALPATTLASGCYAVMFGYCAGLTTAPELPATTLANSCYSGMFSGCTSLTSAPALPATTLANSCYQSMFGNCIGLTTVPMLPATTLASNCYSSMFHGCTSLISVPENMLPATTLAYYCYYNMFTGCTGLTTAPALPATTLAEGCYSHMFEGCTNLTSAPALPATTMVYDCYTGMFQYCSRLESAPALPATTLASGCYAVMFGYCTGLTTAPALPATTLAYDCYSSMFTGCTSLTSAPVLPATTLANSCYISMFSGCTGLTSAPVLPATTLAESCYQSMFGGCTGLTTAPELLATTLAYGCYNYMFYGCSNLSSVTCWATSREDYSTYEWLYNVAENGTFYAPKNNVFGSNRDANNIPENWTLTIFTAAITSAPTAIEGLAYTGDPQTLINAGTASGGEMQYKLGDGEWSADLPQATEAGEYTVYYKVVGDAHHTDFTPAENSIAVSISLSGEGTAESPYLIPNTAAWNYLADKVNAGTAYEGKHFRQTDDISVTTMVGEYSSHPFSGIYDGDGHTLNVTISGAEYYLAPFHYIANATIKNLKVTGSVTVTDVTQRHASGLVGAMGGECVLENCHVSTNVSGTDYMGGLVGHGMTANITIRGCVYSGTLTAEGENYTGGFIAWCDGSTNKTFNISDCLFAGSYSGNGKFHPIGINYHKNNYNNTRNIANTYFTALSNMSDDHSYSFGNGLSCRGKFAHSITAADGVTVANAGDSTIYTVSGITSYGTGIKYNGVLYAGEGDELSLNLTHAEAPVGHSFSHYSVVNGTVTGEANPYTLTMADADAVIDANYSVNQYTITWLDDDNSQIDQTVVEYGAMPAHGVPTKAADAQYTYTFDKWTPAVDYVTGDATYKATYTTTVNTYKVTFAAGENGSVDLSAIENVAYGSEVTIDGNKLTIGTNDVTATPSAQTAEYTYAFVAWENAPATITGATTITATFSATKRSYTIKFVNGEEELQSEVLEYGVLPAYKGATPTKAATAEFTYTFKGWDAEIAAVTGEATYTATFTATKRSYTITWLDDDNSQIDQTVVEYGAMPVHGVPTKAADAQYTYTFDKWTPSVGYVTGDATYKATYTATVNTYKVTFAAGENGSVDLSAIENVAYGSEVTIDGNKLTIGTNDVTATPSAQTDEYTYAFVAWENAPATITGATTITATFSATKRSYVITFKDEDGTVLNAEEWFYGTMPECDEPTKADDEQYTYAFKAWTPEVVSVTGEATYTATYEATEKPHTPTGIGDVQGDNVQSTKVLIDQHVYILRGGKTYTVTGQEMR